MRTIFFALALLLPGAATAQNDAVKVPDEIKAFVNKDMVPIACESGDLNADGRKDYVLVLSKIVPEGSIGDEAGDAPRPTIVLIRDVNNKLSIAAQNDKAAYCKNCGGVFGDPFAGLAVSGTRFTVSNYGGSNDRWADEFTFAYSKRDSTWQLVRVEETTFRATDPSHTTHKHVFIPPKDFGLINFSDFDPENYRKQGKK
jgi:hypothetical protein